MLKKQSQSNFKYTRTIISIFTLNVKEFKNIAAFSS